MDIENVREPTVPARELATICVLAIVAGAVIGVVGGAFRWCLERLERWRIHTAEWAHELPGPGWLVPVGITILGALLAALIVRMVPLASGSGIQHVEAVDRGQAEPPPLSVLPSRFVGALLSIGSGLVLGREGPIVHMGAAVGAETARCARRPEHERLLQTSVSGAGLAVAFNAPIGGALFVFEEVAGSFRFRTVVPVVLSVAAAVVCSRTIVGDTPDFAVDPIAPPSIVLLPVFVVFGLLTGLLGAAYNRMVLGSLSVVESVRLLSPVMKAAIIGGLVGLLSVVAPWAGGGGDSLVQHVVSGGALALPVVAWYVLLRFVAGPLSYAAGTPGGLFAPLLALGALWGLLCAGICTAIVPGIGSSLAVPMAIAGMAALFGASVRAPITGVVLVVEMTAATGVTVPMLAATICAVVVAYSTRVPPIYDSLRDRMFGTPPDRG
ncbi:ClC family H(+)/Cl(-) exchange transporter [Rhodococcus pyridinivorans]|uniref:Cl-channel voltage-gated family protein n=1 Tax=Rhodococcus pyridinivorans AK37 TaxID=1114960 RepID=H0JMZ4_9NOCA|nr:ClC family H(+)/Cl(-) exchange transporter [Rhodococcus pyridinivorans]EHK85255.1 Cl- channel voltage-gated family protein [Rhodococcus pyridinivorans AK37]MCD2139832.1 ClC family H(+)/Cl(-) exchange transporter [Rhodococcus pyridinivorans]